MQQAMTAGKVTMAQKKSGALIPLAMADAGRALSVVAVRGNDETRHYLACLGFVEGAAVSVVSRSGDNIIADVKGARIALGGQLAMRVMAGEVG